MSRHAEWDLACKIYIGGLSEDANRYDLEDAFTKYGPVKNVWVARQPPGFAFVEMEDSRDAQDAAKELNGTRIAGSRVKVEMSTGKARDRRGGGGGGGGRGRSRSRSRDRRRSRTRSRSRGSRRPARRSPSYRSMSRGHSRDRSPEERRRPRNRSRS